METFVQLQSCQCRQNLYPFGGWGAWHGCVRGVWGRPSVHVKYWSLKIYAFSFHRGWGSSFSSSWLKILCRHDFEKKVPGTTETEKISVRLSLQKNSSSYLSPGIFFSSIFFLPRLRWLSWQRHLSVSVELNLKPIEILNTRISMMKSIERFLVL